MYCSIVIISDEINLIEVHFKLRTRKTHKLSKYNLIKNLTLRRTSSIKIEKIR